MAIFVNSSMNGNGGKEEITSEESHSSTNNTKSDNTMSDTVNGIPFSIPYPGFGDCKNSDYDMNNPIYWLIILFLFGGRGFGFGNNGLGMAPGVETQAINSVQIDDIRSKVAEISAQVACGNKDLSGLECALNGLGLQVGSVKDAVLSSLNSIDKSLAQGNMALAQQICQCCCSTKEAISNVDKTILQAQNAMTQGFATVGFGQSNIINALNQGFAQIGYQGEKNTNSIVQAIQTEACNTRQLMSQYHNEDIVSQKNIEIGALTAKVHDLSQSAQTATLLAAINAKTTTAAA